MIKQAIESAIDYLEMDHGAVDIGITFADITDVADDVMESLEDEYDIVFVHLPIRNSVLNAREHVFIMQREALIA